MKRPNYNTILFLFLSLPFFSACFQETKTGSGDVIEEDRNIKGFTGVAVNMSAIVEVTGNASSSVIVSAQENLHDDIVTRIDGKMLVITSKANIINSKPIIIKIGIPNPEVLELNGSGEMNSTNVLESESLDMEVSGSGSMNLSVKVDKLTAMVSGSGTINVFGNSNSFNTQINGSGDVDATEFICNESKATINGSGDYTVHVNKSLDATINGSGDVLYSGNPEVKQSINGSGSVNRF